MNAGAYGGEMKNVVSYVKVLMPDGSLREYTNEEMAFGYRKSRIAKEHSIVLEAVLTLHRGDGEEIRARMMELKEQRVRKQPLEYASAGSTFKRPEGYFAGKTDKKAVGGAEMSTNISKKKREDLLAKIKEIRNFIAAAPQDENTGNLLSYLAELEKDVNGKKYGVVLLESVAQMHLTFWANKK